jgi:glycosyltransferase involved in cell wall biosynthesis
MRILLLSWYFPPGNTIGAIRVGKLARFLHETGHDVRVVCGAKWNMPRTLPLEIPFERVTFTNSLNVAAPLDWATQLRDAWRARSGGSAPRPATAAPAPASGTAGSARAGARFASWLSDLYLDAVTIPDLHVGWIPWAVASGLTTLRGWTPDIIYTSGPPHSVHIAGQYLARRFGIPHVPELRDCWVDDPYHVWPDWKRAIATRLERATLSKARGLVTVSEPWAQRYRQKYGLPVATIYNGYDERDFPDTGPVEPLSREQLVIAYAGVIYAGRRDPTPLFQALKLLGPAAKDVRIDFYGSEPSMVLPAAEAAGVSAHVRVMPRVPYKRSIEVQRAADLLLLLQWNDPKEQGNCPGKLFEYLAVRRPIIGIGLEDGVPAQFIRDRDAGVFSNDPEVIAASLRTWLAQKKDGGVPMLPESARAGLTRDLQFEKLVAFLEEMRQPPRPQAATLTAVSRSASSV